MFQAIVIVSAIFAGTRQAGGYPIPSSVVYRLRLDAEESTNNLIEVGSIDVVDKIYTTSEEMQKSTVRIGLVSKTSKYFLPSSAITLNALNAHNKNPALARSMVANQRSRNRSLDDDESITRPLPEKKTETTSVAVDQSTNTTLDRSKTTAPVDDNSTRTTDHTMSIGSRTTNVLGKPYGSGAVKRETDDKWFSIEVATNADRKSRSPEHAEKSEWPPFIHGTSCHVNKLQLDMRFPDERTDCDEEDKTDYETDWSSFDPIPNCGGFVGTSSTRRRHRLRQ